MAVITTDEFMNKIKSIIGDDTSDETLSAIKDFSDTLSSLSDSSNEIARLNKEIKDQDEAWRKKYRDTFFNGGGEGDPEQDPDDPPEKLTFDSLFSLKE